MKIKTMETYDNEKTENEKVYTIEGNAKGDCCKRNEYNVNSRVILGYGTPMY